MRFQRIPTRLYSVLAIAGLLAASIACTIHGSVELKGSNTGHINYKVTGSVGFSFSIVGSTGNPVSPEYTLDFQGYPYNRVVLNANNLVTNSDGTVTSVPVQLAVGSQFPVTININGFVKTYTTTILAVTGLPAGSYVLDAPGIVQDVQSTLDYSGDVPMTLTLPGSAIGASYVGPTGTLQYSYDQGGDGNVIINFTATDMVVFPQIGNQTKSWDRGFGLRNMAFSGPESRAHDNVSTAWAEGRAPEG
ncbi:MAG TPA: hypothetical protein VK188_09070, partial [Holophaga sp.]|nr:hypothetical protein [Holophaga sp.]